jgi:hypothetical protein
LAQAEAYTRVTAVTTKTASMFLRMFMLCFLSVLS